MKKIFIKMITAVVITLLGVCSGCEESANPDFTDVVIIESYLKPGDIFNLTLKRQIPFTSEYTYSDDDINNLSIALEYNGIEYMLTPMGEGVYKENSIQIQEGDEYSVSFTFNSQNVTASSNIPFKPIDFEPSVEELVIEPQPEQGPAVGVIPDPLILTWENTDNSYYLVTVQNIESNPVSIISGGDSRPPKSFRKPPTNSSIEQIRAFDFQYYGVHRIVVFHVLPDYASLYDQNSNSSQNLTNPSTAISNGYGIFTGVNSDTLYVNVHP